MTFLCSIVAAYSFHYFYMNLVLKMNDKLFCCLGFTKT